MASGHRSLRLTDQVPWEKFARYAETLVASLGGTVVARADSAAERVWDTRIQGAAFWVAFDDFGLGISLDPQDGRADSLIPRIRETLLALRSQEAG